MNQTTLGFSVYLGKKISSAEADYIRQMSQNGFSEVFTSLQIPEEKVTDYLDRLRVLTEMCQQYGLTVVPDISKKALEKLDLSVVQLFKLVGLTRARLDDGFSNQVIANLSRNYHLALNASTITAADIAALHQYKANFSHLEAWHNFYPRPETGLETEWFKQKNKWLQTNGFTIMAFVPGDGQQRGPLFAGLPTLEADRTLDTFVAMVKMQSLGVDKIFVGDPEISATQMARIKDYFVTNIVTIKGQLATQWQELYQQVFHQRKDIARDVIRLVEGRSKLRLQVADNHRHQRQIGAITIDNAGYGRYMSELQIDKANLSADPRVNVIGQVAQSDLTLLSLLGPGQAIRFIEN